MKDPKMLLDEMRDFVPEKGIWPFGGWGRWGLA